MKLSGFYSKILTRVFDFKQTNEELFATNRLMKNRSQLAADIDSMTWQIFDYNYRIYQNTIKFFEYHLKGYYEIPQRLETGRIVLDSLEMQRAQDSVRFNQIKRQQTLRIKQRDKANALPKRKDLHRATVEGKSKIMAEVTWQNRRNKEMILKAAASKARQSKNTIKANLDRIQSFERHIHHHQVEKYKKLAEAVACLIMFTIGAPLGAIIKRGGLGVPVIISIIFYVFYYVVTLTTQKWVKEGLMDPILGVWMANIILFPLGLIFLRQARNDVRLFDSDYYSVVFSRLISKLNSKGHEPSLATN